MRNLIIRGCISLLKRMGIPTIRNVAGGSALCGQSIESRLTPLNGLDQTTQEALLSTGRILIDPMPTFPVGECSLNLYLGDNYTDRGPKQSLRDTKTNEPMPLGEKLDIPPHGVWIEPGGFILGVTQEFLGIPTDLMAQFFVVSSVAQQGMFCVGHSSSIGDPGFGGKVVLELHNNTGKPFHLYPGQKLIKAVFWLLDEPAAQPYFSRSSHESANPLRSPSSW